MSTETCNIINAACCSPDVFMGAEDEVKHVVQILDARCLKPAERSIQSDQLRFLCQRYVKRYSKRMEILQRLGGQHFADQNLSTAAKIRIFLERPFASKGATAFFVGLSLVVCFSSALVVAQSVPSLNPVIFPDWEATWLGADIGASCLFFIEVVVRCIATTLDTRQKPWYENLKDFFKEYGNIIDIAACTLPVPAQIYGREYSFLNVFRLLRMFRVFYFLRHFEAFEDLEVTIRNSLSSLSGPLIALIVGLVGFASLIYTLESGSWNEQTMQFMVRDEDCEMSAPAVLGKIECERTESKFISAVHAMWFVLITFLQVGYGDIVPLTMGGRAMGGITIVAGSLFMAMPIAIVGTNFTIAIDRLREERRSVRILLARRQYESESRKEAANANITRPAPLPSLALLRFLRLTLRTNAIDLENITKRVPYYVDLYLERVAQQFLHPDFSDSLQKLALRAGVDRKPFAGKLAMLKRPASKGPARLDQHSISLHRPLSLMVGSAASCDVRLLHTSNVVRASLMGLFSRWEGQRSLASRLMNRRESAGAIDLQRNPTAVFQPADDEVSNALDFYAEQESGPGDTRMIAPEHAQLSIVNYGGSHDRLYVVPIHPYCTIVGSQSPRNGNIEVSGSGGPTLVRFDPSEPSAGTDRVTLTLQRGVEYTAIKLRQ